MPRPRLRTESLREHLLDTAIDVLAEGGPTAVTTRDVAARAGTSAAAIYELFEDKAGLIRAVFFEGFRRLRDELAALPPASGSREDIVDVVRTFRAFTLRDPHLFEVMYGHPFEAFSPNNHERRLGDATRAIIVGRIQRCIDAETLEGDAVDIAHAVMALVIGLATQETAGWLGKTRTARERRWEKAVASLLVGCSHPADDPASRHS